MKELAKQYDPSQVEDRIYQFWLDGGYFHTKADPDKKPYTIVMPPPNVTGQLHMGHAVDNTMQDILIRTKRMQGYAALWVPGTDHASIATEAKVVEAMRAEGLTKEMVGRDGFLERAWAWKTKYGNRIVSQLKKLGSSCDWERERFTMDEGCSEAVKEVFVRLYDKGLIYRGNRMVNWCPHCNTSISDAEVEYEEKDGSFWHLLYPVKETGEMLELATTRPETMLGDTAVAINGDDPRYAHLHGCHVVLPLLNKEIPIVCDEHADMTKGTGVVKITPAHDPNDFEVGLRHDLPIVRVFTYDGHMTGAADKAAADALFAAGKNAINEPEVLDCGKYAGMTTLEARKAILADLEAGGFLKEIEPLKHEVGTCYRCHSTIEPMVSKQWFVKMEPLAKPAIESVEKGEIKFVPERFTKNYMNWMKGTRDWCISRQLWWGHQIPAWYCDDCGETSVSRTDLTECPHCHSHHIHQDEDVLDTWFSSGLWPFETFGWPDKTPELEQFYPTATLVTGYDIIFFWVARMVMMGLEFGKDIPFHHVFIHGLVRDSQGRKMSKSLGNGIDPVEVVEKYGADTLRFMLITGNTPGNDMRFYWERVESARNFANKIWNASRYMLMNLEGFDKDFKPEESDFTLADKWILSRYAKTAEGVTKSLDNFELGEAGRMIYEFIWNEFCDWYIELTKARLYDKENERAKNTALYVLSYVLEHTLRLLHPFMPFLTEEIWQKVPHDGQWKSIMIADWPTADEALCDDAAEAQMTAIMETIKTVRNLRAEVGAAPGHKSEVMLHFTESSLRPVFAENEGYLKALAAAEPVTLLADDAEKPENAMAGVVGGVEIYLPLKGLIDVEKETARLQKELDKLEKEIGRLSGKLSNEGFLKKAPEAVVAKEREKLAGYEEKKQAVEGRIQDLAKL